MEKIRKITGILSILLLTIVLLSVFHFIITKVIFKPIRFAYVETAKLMIGFNEASKVDKELKSEDEKWKSQLKILQDSLTSHIEVMSKEYDKSSSSRKKELQDMLSAWNQKINNFKQANFRKMEKLRAEKMQGIIQKTNVYISEYGKKHKYSIIFGTVAGGSILYGDEAYNITDDIIAGLNERYK